MLSIKEWVLEQYDIDEIKDINKYGWSGKFSGLTYYSETNEFHDNHDDEIWNMLHDDASDNDCTIIELIGDFNGQKKIDSMATFKNLLTWYAVEKVCQEIVNEQGEKENVSSNN